LSQGGNDDGSPAAAPTAAAATATTTVPPGPFAVGDGPDGVAVAGDAVWVAASRGGTLTRVDAVTGETATVDVGDNPDSVLVALGSVWVSVTGEDKVVRLTDGAKPEVVDSFDVGAGPEGLAASSRAIWVANSGDGSVTQILPETGETNTVAGVGRQPVDVAVGAARCGWPTPAAGSRASTAGRATSRARSAGSGRTPARWRSSGAAYGSRRPATGERGGSTATRTRSRAT
jgi:hypothetical protein